MKNHPQDAALRHLLRESWTVDTPPSPNFRAQVWARIEALRREPQTWSAWLRFHLLGVGMAAVASVAVAVIGAGSVAQNKIEHDRDQLVGQYVDSINPHARVGVALASYTP